MYLMKKQHFIYFALSALLLILFCSGRTITVRAEESDAKPYQFEYPDDPYNDAMWSYDNPGFYTHYYGTFPVTQYCTPDIDMNILEAWEQYPLPKEDTRTVVIAIIDTGVDYRHPDLKDQMWTNPGEIADNGIDDDGNGYIDDIYGWDFYNNDNSVCHYLETAKQVTEEAYKR